MYAAWCSAANIFGRSGSIGGIGLGRITIDSIIRLHLANSAALPAFKSPAPVAVSYPTVATEPFPPTPIVTSVAVDIRNDRTRAGEMPGYACKTNAQAPAICGAAADVPLIAAQPSFVAVSSPFGCGLPLPKAWSISQLAGSGNIK